MTYDSLGRLVQNIEPNTSVVDKATGSVWSWLYAYYDAGELVGTSEARPPTAAMPFTG